MSKFLNFPCKDIMPLDQPGNCSWCSQTALWEHRGDMFRTKMCAACIFKETSWSRDNRSDIDEYLELVKAEADDPAILDTITGLNSVVASLWATNMFKVIQNLAKAIK